MKPAYFFTIGLAFIFGALCLPSHVIANSIDDLDLLTENYPPFNFERKNMVQGISVDLLAEMLKKTGSLKTIKEIEVLPWTKGYKAVQRNKNTMLFIMIRTESREPLFKWVGPIMRDQIAIIARKDRKISINSLRDLNKFKTGVVRDDVAELLLLEAGVNPGNLYETVSRTGGENLGRMLAAGRIDLWAYSKIAAMWNLRESGFSPDNFKAIYVLQESDAYFALHKDTHDAIVAQLQAALEEVRSSGRLRKIIRNYLPNF